MFDRENENRSTNSPSEEVGFAVPARNPALQMLEDVAPPPRTKTNQRRVVLGALYAAQAAISGLVKPNALAQSRLAQLCHLAQSLTENYADEQACDLSANVDRTLSQFPAWRALNLAGNSDLLANNAFLHLLGVHFMVALLKPDGLMCSNHCNRLRKDSSLPQMSLTDLRSICMVFDEDRRPKWLTVYRSEWPIFVRSYDEEIDPTAGSSARDFTELVRGQILNHSMYAQRGQREAVLTDRCLSEAQMQIALTSPVHLPFSDPGDKAIALWLTGFAGLTFDHLSQIPVNDSAPNGGMRLDINSGRLHRNFHALVRDPPIGTLREAEPANLRCQIPMPMDLSTRLRILLCKRPRALTLAELIPEINKIQSNDAIYPCMSTLTPSWARFKNTIGTYLRAHGMDSLVVAVLTGDFGHTMKSKLHYCNLAPKEIHAGATRAYALLGLDAPIAFADLPAGLGLSLVPTRAALLSAAEFSGQEVASRRPGRNVKDIARLIEFHNAYTLAVALRICLALALRNTSKVMLPQGSLAAVFEKAIAGRAGGMPAIIPAYIQRQVRLYQMHCAAMANRLPNISCNQFAEWLRSGSFEDLKTCGQFMSLQDVSSTNVMRFVNMAADLPVDVGRKFLENELRRRGMPTMDIDRIMRHEVLGQAAMSSTNFDSVASWGARVGTVLDEVLMEIFGQPLVGLRGESL